MTEILNTTTNNCRRFSRPRAGRPVQTNRQTEFRHDSSDSGPGVEFGGISDEQPFHPNHYGKRDQSGHEQRGDRSLVRTWLSGFNECVLDPVTDAGLAKYLDFELVNPWR